MEYLKPNTTNGVYCKDETLKIENEALEQIFNHLQEILRQQFPTIKIKKLKNYYKT